MLETFQGHKSPRGSEGVSALEQDEDPLTAGTGSQKGPRRGSRRPIPQGTRTGEGRKVWSQGGRASVETKTSLVQHRQVRAQPGVPTFPGSDPGNLSLAGCLGQGISSLESRLPSTWGDELLSQGCAGGMGLGTMDRVCLAGRRGHRPWEKWPIPTSTQALPLDK